LQISNSTGTLANGTELYIWGDSASTTVMDVNLSVKNISTGTVNVKAKEIPSSLVSGAKVSLCFAGSCYAEVATTFISPSSASIAPNVVNSTFTGEYHPLDHLGASTVIFEFFNTGNTSDSAWVVVNFNASPTAIKEIAPLNAEISNPYPNPAANFTSFNYSTPNYTGNTRIVITNILGSVVKEMNIENEGKITINTSDLNDGIYMYSFIVDDKLIQTKRLIIQH
jgi:hypothetical protein